MKSILAKLKPTKRKTSPKKPVKLDDVAPRRAHNEQQPVSRLIRAGVFHSVLLYLSDTYPPGRSKSAPHGITLGWIHVTHICSSLRYIALDISVLWAQHVCAFDSEDAFKELCRRAKDVPIAIDNVRSHGFYRDPARYVVPEFYWTAMTHAKCSSLSLNMTNSDRVVGVLSTHVLPHIHTLNLRFRNANGRSASEFVMHAPQLQHVNLFNVYFPLAWQTLVSITLDGFDWTGQFNADVITRSLEAAVNLQCLKLRGMFCASELTRVVKLPSLIELVLQGARPLYIAAQLVHPQLKAAVITHEGLAKISVLPSLASIHCKEDFWASSTQCGPKVYLLTFGRWLRLTIQALVSIQEIQTKRDGSVHSAEERSKPSCSELVPLEPQLDILTPICDVSKIAGSHTEMFETIVRTHAKLAPSMLTAVDVVHFASYSSPVQVLNWRALCEPFPLTHTLVLGLEQPRADKDDGLLAALAQVTPEGGLMLPKLRTIVVDKPVPWPEQDRARFREMLAVRAKHGAPVMYVRDVREPGEISSVDRAYYEDSVRL